MRVFITGATGFIGRALTLRLRRDGHHVTAFVRDVERAKSLLSAEADFLETSVSDEQLFQVLEETDAVVNLAGAPVLGGRWSADRKKAILESRKRVTGRLVGAFSKMVRPPQTLVSASAVGFYGDGGETVLTEDSAAGSGFLADVCRVWEDEAAKARDSGVRVAILRIGVVLGRGGGALDQMLPAFRLGAGGPVGSGRQFVPWIHLEDVVEMFATALADDRFDGVFNATGPEPVPFKKLASELGKALHRPAFLPVPTVALKAIFGSASVVLTQGQRAIPKRAQDLGFSFQFNTVREALTDLTQTEGVSITPFVGPLPDIEYVRRNKPTHQLEATALLDCPLDEVWSFFSQPQNLGLITPSGMQFRITHLPSEMGEGAEIRYTLRVGPVPLKWTTRIEAWEQGVSFADSQQKGPYSCWWHEHHFEAKGDQTLMTDRVLYAAPAGPIGRLANAVFVADELRGVFGYRTSVVRLRFGTAD